MILVSPAMLRYLNDPTPENKARLKPSDLAWGSAVRAPEFPPRLGFDQADAIPVDAEGIFHVFGRRFPVFSRHLPETPEKFSGVRFIFGLSDSEIPFKTV